jgi:hypothetical protein
MNPEWKAKWLTALRSGKYKQGHGALRCVNGQEITHCCLGVLGDLMNPNGWLRPKGDWNNGNNVRGFKRQGHTATDYLPADLQDRAGLFHEDQEWLASLNDDNGLTFDEIADRIEQDL